MVELERKGPLLADDAGKFADQRKQRSANVAELAFAKSVLKAREATMKAKNRELDELSSKLGLARAVFSRKKRVIHDFAEWMCTGYAYVMATQVASYRDILKAFLTDAELRGSTFAAIKYFLGRMPIPFNVEKLIVTWSTGIKPPCRGDDDAVIASPPPPFY